MDIRRVKLQEREADDSPPSSAEVRECLELYFHFPNMPSWRGAQFKQKKKSTGTSLPLPSMLFYILRESYQNKG